MRAAYSRRTCRVCGQEISSAGCAWVAHMRKHVREGKVREDVHPDAKSPFWPAYGAQYIFIEVKTGKWVG